MDSRSNSHKCTKPQVTIFYYCSHLFQALEMKLKVPMNLVASHIMTPPDVRTFATVPLAMQDMQEMARTVSLSASMPSFKSI
ncbi:hypothetical protein EMCRGX_G033608 [Ephydatia muelleri]